jgi:hypothetical protein
MQHYFLKLNLKATEAHRMSWNHQYFNLEGVLFFEEQITSQDQARKALECVKLVLKMVPFKNEFKAKLFSHILSENKEEKSDIFALTATVNLFEKKVLDVLDFQQGAGVVDAHGQSPLMQEETTPVTLSEGEKNELMRELNALVQGPMLPHLHEPFVCFFPEFVSASWKERLPKNRKDSSLIPFQALFPFSGAFERVHNDKFYVMDDMYCVSPKCLCGEVNCLVITFDDRTGQEVLAGGFKYHFEKKSFKNNADIPGKINAQEWFKQFSLKHPVSLNLLCESRYHFLRELLKS